MHKSASKTTAAETASLDTQQGAVDPKERLGVASLFKLSLESYKAMAHMMEHTANVSSIAMGPAAPAEPAVMRELCDGSLDPDLHYGSWQGHMLPGLLFVCWGAWMAFASFQLYLRSLQSPGTSTGALTSKSTRARTPRAYAARAWHLAPWARLRLLEPYLKLFLTSLGLLMELRLDHDAYVYVVVV